MPVNLPLAAAEAARAPAEAPGLPLRLVDRPDIVLVTEGTYPHAHGGVSVWCDQLVQGLPDHAFRLVALTAFGYQRPVWDLPAHVQELVTVGLWDRLPGRRPRPHATTRPTPPPLVTSPAGPAAPRGPSSPAGTLAALLAAPGDDVARFGRFVDEVAALDPARVAAELSFGPLVAALDRELTRRRDHAEAVRPARASDLVRVAGMLEHLLRPVTVDAGPAAVYHASSNGLAALVCLVARRRHGCRFLLTEHGIYLRERYLELRRLPMARPAKALLVRFHRLVSALAYAEADVVAPGSSWNQRWEGRHGAPHHRVRPIHNGIDPGTFPDRAAEPDEPVVAWLGRIDPIKDLETLVESFGVVHGKRPDARLRIYGRTPAGNEAYRDELDALVESLGLAGVVTFEGGVGESAEAWVGAQVGALSSISEGFPYSLIEAMACGLPAVATGVGGVAEAVADTGLVVPPRAPELFGEALLELLGDGPRRREMGARARERVLDHFTLDGCLDAYRRVYAELAAAREPAAGARSGVGAGAGAGAAAGTGAGAPGVRGLVRRADRDELTAALGGAEALVEAVDADDVAATLESVGVTDDVAAARFGAPDVFDLAERMWSYATMLRRSGRIFHGDDQPPRPPTAVGPEPVGAWSRGLAYVLPAVVVAAAAQGGADESALVAASVLGWGLAQAGGVLAYTAHHRAPPGQGLVALRRGVGAAVLGTAVAAVAVGGVRGGPSGVAFALPLLHLVAATTVVMAGHVAVLLGLLAPAAVVSTAAVVSPGGPATALVGPAATATVVATLTTVGGLLRRAGPGRKRGGAAGLLERADWLRAGPLAVSGWLTAVFALLAVGAVGHLPGFDDVDGRHWLLVALPLWLMVAGSEWLLASLRRALAAELEAAPGLAPFRSSAARASAVWLGAGLAGLAGASLAGAAGAVALSDLSWLVAASAAAVFATVAAALFGTTVLTGAARTGRVAGVMALAVAALAWVTVTPHNPLGLGDHTVSLCIGGLVAFSLGLQARLVLLDPAAHR